MLKKWEISKNTKREMWEYVDHILRKREKQGKESQVHMHGIRLSDTRVKKFMQRYGRISLAEKFRTGVSVRSQSVVHLNTNIVYQYPAQEALEMASSA